MSLALYGCATEPSNRYRSQCGAYISIVDVVLSNRYPRVLSINFALGYNCKQ